MKKIAYRDTPKENKLHELRQKQDVLLSLLESILTEDYQKEMFRQLKTLDEEIRQVEMRDEQNQ